MFGIKKDKEDKKDKIEKTESGDVPEKKGFFARLKEGLTKTRKNLVYNIDTVFNDAETIDDEFYEELEEVLIMGDLGVNATEEIIATGVERMICVALNALTHISAPYRR